MSRRDRSERSSRRITLLAIGGGVLLLAQLVVLILSFGQISSTENHVAATDAKVDRAFALAAPVADEVAPAIDDLTPAIEDSAPLVRNASSLLRPLAGSGDDLAVLLQRFPVLDIGLRQLIAAGLPFLEALDPSQLGATAATVQRLVDQTLPVLSNLDSLGPILDQAAALLAAIDNRDLVDRAVQSDRTLRQALAVQSSTLEVQRRAFEVQRRSLRIQRRTLARIRSIDERTGGIIVPPRP